MAVVRIDDELLEEIRKFIGKEENRYKYPSVTAFLNVLVYEKMHKLNGRKK